MNKIDRKDMVKLMGVSKASLAIMMEYLELSFMLFGRSECVNSLDKLLNILDKDDLGKDFQDTGLHYVHKNGIAHGDITTSNILVSNQDYYNSLQQLFPV